MFYVEHFVCQNDISYCNFIGRSIMKSFKMKCVRGYLRRSAFGSILPNQHLRLAVGNSSTQLRWRGLSARQALVSLCGFLCGLSLRCGVIWLILAFSSFRPGHPPPASFEAG